MKFTRESEKNHSFRIRMNRSLSRNAVISTAQWARWKSWMKSNRMQMKRQPSSKKKMKQSIKSYVLRWSNRLSALHTRFCKLPLNGKKHTQWQKFAQSFVCWWRKTSNCIMLNGWMIECTQAYRHTNTLAGAATEKKWHGIGSRAPRIRQWEQRRRRRQQQLNSAELRQSQYYTHYINQSISQLV